MRTKLIIFAALALAGCTQDVVSTGSHLRAVDERAMTSQTLYMMPGLNDYPMTADELTTQQISIDEAIPVRIEIFDAVAVAWYAPNGEPIIGRDAIVALWPVVQRAEISNDLAPGNTTATVDPTITSPEGSVYLTMPTLDGEYPTTTTNNTTSPSTPDPSIDYDSAAIAPPEQTIIDFIDRIGSQEETYLMQYLTTLHPGCL